MNPSKTIVISTLLVTSITVLAGCTTFQTANTNTATTTVVVNTNETANTEQGSAVDTSDGVLRSPEGEADWLTYTNEEYGFSFKYPEEWEINDYSSTNLFVDIPDQALRLQFNSDESEYHMVLYKNNVENITEEIKNSDPSASFLKAEKDIIINANNYKYLSVLSAIGSLVDYYIQSYGSEYTIVWVANPYTDQSIIRDWIKSFSANS
ncbi:MAG: hypothetical protein HYV33_04900 [Candidatus Kerfeldbacteria bacterium]|nr:hypothetical protein [Candidatus Kerfeldbacteria bacterium]